MKGEIWKDVKDYEGLYQVSNMGRVKSLNYNKTGKERIMKSYDSGHGYLQVQLCKDGKGKCYYVHRLVATAFLENPEGYNEVNHLDEDKTNNCVENLEYCSRLYNINYGTRTEKTCKPVFSVNKESGLVTYWESASEASRQLNISQSHICACCQGKRNSAGNHIWFYADDDDNE